MQESRPKAPRFIAYFLPVDNEKLKQIMQSFILSQSSYWPLLRMFYVKHLDNKINQINTKALSIGYKDSVSDFNALLKKDNSVSVPKRNPQLLMTVIYKNKMNITQV